MWIYTFDVTEGIDSDWADTQADTWTLGSAGHAKLAVGHLLALGTLNMSDTTAGATGKYTKWKMEMLVWVP